MDFEVLGPLAGIETIAVAAGIRELDRLRKLHGDGRWRKLKGFGTIRLKTGEVVKAELHWYEAAGIGKRELKIKRFVE